MIDRPKSPGLRWRPRHSRMIPMWIATKAAIAAGYPIKSVNLSHFAHDHALLTRRCERLQSEMLAWISDRKERGKVFDGTFDSLIAIYQTDLESCYRALKPSSRHPYDVYAKRLVGQIGARRIDACDGRDVKRWFEVWSVPHKEGGKPKIAAARMTLCVLKAAIDHGIISRLRNCAEFRTILDRLEFPSNRPRPAAPFAEEILRVRAAAHAERRPRRALADALQFETTLRQWDVIGEWVPISDPRKSALLSYGMKWIGLTWSQIDSDHILRTTPSKTEDTTEARITIDLKECPMAMEEFARIPIEERVGPVIVDERTSLPYRHENWRAAWRRDAEAAGLSKDVWNRDLRAGGITEARKGGASIDDLKKTAGHSGASRMTAQVYDRDTIEAHRRVARARARHRMARTGDEPTDE